MPFPELHGEFTEYVGRAEDAIIAMSNYRLHIKFKESVVNVSIFEEWVMSAKVRYAQNNRRINYFVSTRARLCESVY